MPLSERDQQLALSSFPFLAEASRDVQQSFFSNAIYQKIPENNFICMDGQSCGFLPLVHSGVARVYKASDSGREITLYRIYPGGVCILTGSCILNGRVFPAYAVAETEVEGFVVPSQIYRVWMEQYRAWQNFIFAAFADRMSILVETVEEAIFGRLDSRVANLLLELPRENPRQTITTTHEAIATELGSSREVVSRLLKGFEREGLVELGRGTIRIVDDTGLRRKKS